MVSMTEAARDKLSAASAAPGQPIDGDDSWWTTQLRRVARATRDRNFSPSPNFTILAASLEAARLPPESARIELDSGDPDGQTLLLSYASAIAGQDGDAVVHLA